MPTAIGVAGIAALGATAVEHLRAPDRPIAAAASEDDDEGGDPPRIWNRLFLGVALSLMYIASLRLIGFLPATPMFLVALGLLMRSGRPVRDAIAGIGLTVRIWLMFTRLLYVSLP